MQGEYNSIRAELVAAVSTQQTVMSYGLAAMAVMFTGLLSTWPNLAIRIGILSLASLATITHYAWGICGRFASLTGTGRVTWGKWLGG